MPALQYLDVRKDLKSRGYTFRRRRLAHPRTEVKLEFYNNTLNPTVTWKYRVIISELLTGRELAWAVIPRTRGDLL